MKQFMTMSMAALLSTTLAAPAYIPYVYSAGQPSIDSLPITANNGYFWIGKPTTATCPPYDPICPSKTTTIISGPNWPQIWWMGILEEGGQRIFTPSGGSQPGYSAAGTNNYTPNRASYSYVLQTETSAEGRLVLKYLNEDWAACETEVEGVYAVMAGSHKDCLSFAWELRETTAPAPQYYDCVGCESRCDNSYGCK